MSTNKPNDLRYDQDEKKKSSRSKVIIFILLVVLVIAAVFIVGLIVALVVTVVDDDDDGEQTCESETCEELAAVVGARMNANADPCEDFFEFACGGFVAEQGTASETVLGLARDQLYETLGGIIGASDYDAGGVDALQKMKTFYDSCIDTQTIDAQGVQPLLDLIAETGGWNEAGIPESTPWSLNGDQFFKESLLGSSAFFSFGVFGDLKESTTPVIYLVQSGLTLGAPEYYTNDLLWNEYVRVILRGTIQTMFQKLFADTADVFLAAVQVVDFERQLAMAFVPTPEADITSTSNYNRMTLGDLETLWPYYDWVANIQRFLSTVGISVDSSEPVIMVHPAYFENLGNLISSTQLSILKNYAKWQLVDTYMAVLDTDTATLHHDLERLILGRVTDERVVDCIDFTQNVIPLAIARPFVENILPSGSRDAVGEMISEIKSGFKVRINQQDWMDKFTRERAKEKVDTLTSKIAFPARILDDEFLNEEYEQYNFAVDDFFGNFLQYVNVSVERQLRSLREPVDRSRFLAPPTDVNANYFPLWNQITILAGIMTPPFYHSDWPIASRYGSLGAIIGHEISHGFDDSGRNFNPEGNLDVWWSNSSVQNYEARAQCFIDQYSQYQLFGVAVNGQQTLGENIADNGGVRASYQAYKDAINKEGSSQRLPDLSYTSDQLFFISWSQSWCSVTSEFLYLLRVFGDVHSPPNFRAFVPLVNNAEFASTFDCPVGSPMNPEEKCLIW